MGRGFHSASKRDREAKKARKKREKAEMRQRKREEGPREIEVVSSEELMAGLPSVEEAAAQLESNAQRPRRSSGPPCRLFVGGVGHDAGETEVREAFEAFGTVIDCFFPRDRATGEPRGFGFVTLSDRRDAAKAIEALDGSELQGRILAVKVASERPR